MIKLTKQPEPAVLAANSVKWTAELIAALATSDGASKVQKNKYNKKEIKEAIVIETHGKCAYCESKMRHVSPGDIEHIVPKSLSPELSFAWDNLTLACTTCNTNKSNKPGIIDPYLDEPTEHLLFSGPMIFKKNGSQLGFQSIKFLDLNRFELISKRAEKLSSVERMLASIDNGHTKEVRDLLFKEIVKTESMDEAEYAACTRQFIERGEDILGP